ncbi:MAG: hypothetical protein MUE52_09580 [Tabrizicola sp.]|jgi:hypothetical protein|nr:hypothetical protein [Tabrizicola sp.]
MTCVQKFGTRGLVLTGLLGLLAACVSSLEPLNDEIRTACINEAGITGSYSVTATLMGDRMTYVVGPGTGTRQAQTDIANACIQRRLGAGAAVAAAPVASRPAPAVGSQCVAGGGSLQGGAGYC